MGGQEVEGKKNRPKVVLGNALRASPRPVNPMMRERVLRSLRITRIYGATDRAVLLLGATPEFLSRVSPLRLS